MTSLILPEGYKKKPSVKKRLAKKKAIARHKKELRKRQRSNN